jgi:hypothetical protein
MTEKTVRSRSVLRRTMLVGTAGVLGGAVLRFPTAEDRRSLVTTAHVIVSGRSSSRSARRGLPLCRPSHPRLDELGDFGDLVADFAALAAAGLWQVHVGSLPRTCSGLRLQKRAVLLAGGDRGGGLFNDTHRRHHGPRPKAHPPNTDAREIRDFGNTLRHHDVDRQRRE